MATIGKISILVPCYNELPTIGRIYNSLNSLDLGTHKEIIFIDDKSTDGTREFLLEKSKNASEGFKYIFNEANSGKGACIRKAIKSITGDYAIIQDADLEYNTEDIVKLVEHVNKYNSSVVYGTRNGEIKNNYNYKIFYFGVVALTKIANFLYKQNLTDIETCYKLIDSRIIRFLDLQDPGFGIEIEITAKISKLRIPIAEVPIHYTPRSYKEGKKIKVTDGIKAFWFLFKYRFSDLHFGAVDILIRSIREDAVHRNVIFTNSDTVLDIGCGKQASLAWQLYRKVHEFTGFDLDVANMDFQNVSLVKGDVDGLCSVFKNKKFTKIIGLAIIEHVNDSDKFITDCRELLTDGGQLIMTTPRPVAHPILVLLSELGFIDRTEIDDHKRYFTPDKLRTDLEKHNFKVRVVKSFCGGVNCLYIAEK